MRVRSYEEAAMAAVAAASERLEAVEAVWYERMQAAFARARVAEADFAPRLGYGFQHPGIRKLEAILAELLGTEDCLFRPQVVSGTQALTVVLQSLRRGRLLFPLGVPYDTLRRTIGIEPGGTAPPDVTILPYDVGIDPERLARKAPPGPGLALVQRSMGYEDRPTARVGEIGRIVPVLKSLGYTVVVDNCYGEWTEAEEPGHVGADLVVGSFMKNPGGTLAPYGAYVAGRRTLLEAVAAYLYGPAVGREAAPHGDLRPYFQGLYLSPHLVGQALRAAVFGAALFAAAGYAVTPAADEPRGCIVQAVSLGDPERVVRFCRAVQAHSPVDSHVRPEPAPMPGYADPVVMAAGTFVPGATLELSADAALRPPFRVTFQGGPVFAAARRALVAALASLAT
jgi:cystathionine beta-lyase family protein involved in aluminum resistance